MDDQQPVTSRWLGPAGGWPATAPHPLHAPLRELALRCLLPTLLANIVIGNQLWMVGPFYLGQILLWVALGFAALIVLGHLRGAAWACLLFLAIPLTRMLEAAIEHPVTTLAYYAALNGAFLLAGMLAALEDPGLIYRQVRFFLALCLPFMILQVAGGGAWTQGLNTEYWITEEDIGLPKEVFPTLFVAEDDLRYSVGQGRPAGLLHSNNILSLVILFGFALHLGRTRTRRLSWTDFVLVATMVLAMAKIVVAGFLAMSLWVLVAGDRDQRAHLWRVYALAALCYAAYAWLFPGLFAVQVSVYKILYSITTRLVDIVASLRTLDDAQRDALLNAIGDAPNYDYGAEEDVGQLSGYATLLRLWPFLIGGALVAVPLFVWGLRRVYAQAPAQATTAVLALLTVVLFPAAVPFFRAQLYWFVFGFAAIPFAIIATPALVRDRLRTPPMTGRPACALAAENA